jgi:hypothetical protein
MNIKYVWIIGLVTGAFGIIYPVRERVKRSISNGVYFLDGFLLFIK